jgi:signal transduction histidine kinase
VRQAGDRFELQDLPPLNTGALIRGVGVDSRGDVWLGVGRNGSTPLYRRHGDTWQGYTFDLTLASLLVDSTDNVWLGTSDNRIARFSNGHWQIFEAAEGAQLGATRTLVEGNGAIWAGGTFGVAAIVNDQIHRLTTVGGHSIVGVTGLVAGQDGELWINGTQGVTRISAPELRAFLADPRHEVTFLRLGFRDGVEGFATQGGPFPSLVGSADGRLWFATSGGLYWIDPAKLRPSAAPRSFITALFAEDRPHTIASSITLPERTRRVQVRFAAPELVSPEKIMFRYRLNGVDTRWRNAGAERSATYTNLDPGSYEFEVVASNDHGEWRGEPARLRFSIEPAFMQTRAFALSSMLAAAALLVLLYYARLRQLSRRIAAESNARHAERERIARDLHDTLLQALQGLILRLHTKVSRPSSAEQLREQIAADLDAAEQLLQEGRDRVHDLAVDPSDVPQLIGSFERCGARLAEGSQIRFAVESMGEPRALQPGTHRELSRIVHEAIGNAFKHAAAKNIRVLVDFADAGLEISVVDDGQGIPASVLARQGREGHLGMQSMAQRAALIDAQLSMGNLETGGARVLIRLPRTAYLRKPR